MSQRTDARALIRALAGQGFTVQTCHGRSSSRCRVTSPDGRIAVIPGLSARTNARALLNARAALRRIGADV